MTRDGVIRFVRRGRACLEMLRLLRAAARGALVGGALGLVVLIASRLGLAGPTWLPWACAAGASVAAVVLAFFRRAVPLPAAALLLDERLQTDERLVTVVTREPGRHSERVLRQLDGRLKLPRLGLPREVSLVPAALFLLFAAGLLPHANGETATSSEAGEPAVRGAAATAPTGVRPSADVGAAIARMAQGAAPRAEDVATLRDVIERRVMRPEERMEALAALERAARGDGEAAKRIAETLRAASGGQGHGDTAPDTPDGALLVGPRDGAASVDAYPEHRSLVLAYRRALAEEK